MKKKKKKDEKVKEEEKKSKSKAKRETKGKSKKKGQNICCINESPMKNEALHEKSKSQKLHDL